MDKEEIIHIQIQGPTLRGGWLPTVKIPKLKTSNVRLEVKFIKIGVPYMMLNSGDRFKDFRRIWGLRCNLVTAKYIMKVTNYSGDEMLECSQENMALENMKSKPFDMLKLVLAFNHGRSPLCYFNPEITTSYQVDLSILDEGELKFRFVDEVSAEDICGFNVHIEAVLIMTK